MYCDQRRSRLEAVSRHSGSQAHDTAGRTGGMDARALGRWAARAQARGALGHAGAAAGAGHAGLGEA